MLDRLAGYEYYCFLDGYSGYNQIAIASEDQEKTTFVTPRPRGEECAVHDTVGVYKSTKCPIVVFWRLKWEMINLWNPEFWY